MSDQTSATNVPPVAPRAFTVTPAYRTEVPPPPAGMRGGAFAFATGTLMTVMFFVVAITATGISNDNDNRSATGTPVGAATAAP